MSSAVYHAMNYVRRAVQRVDAMQQGQHCIHWCTTPTTALLANHARARHIDDRINTATRLHKPGGNGAPFV
jgi:hypothetical protein